jgi:PAS domain S-box-containing protein
VLTKISNSQHVSDLEQLPEEESMHDLLASISLGILSLGGGNFIQNFANTAGKAIDADLLLVSRVKSKAVPVETYALYDKTQKMKQYSYPIIGTPCEQVVDNLRSFTVQDNVATCFPEDRDLETLGLHSYIGTPLFDEHGKAVGLIAALWKYARDGLQSELRALEYFAPIVARDMLQLESKARHELAIAGASSGYWYTDFEADMEYMSSAALRIFGQADAKEKAPRNTMLHTLPAEEQRIVVAAFEAYRLGEAPYDVNFRVVSKKGTTRWLRMTGKAKRNLQGRIIAIAGDITDISDLVEAKRASEAASKAKSDFLATMSHEIRTPMNGVLSMAGILSKADIPTQHKRQAEIIKKSGEAMMVILNDVLDLSKVEAGKLELETREFSPRELIEDVAMLWRDTLEQKGITFTVNFDDTVPQSIIGDDTRLRQVLTNLLSNALKFTETGTITLALETVENNGKPMLKFSVSDTGIGIAKAQRKRLFSAFEQANNSIARRFGGTGLGLAISNKIVRLMGGGFEVESTPGKGSTFSFMIEVKAESSSIPVENGTKAHANKQEEVGPAKSQETIKRSILIAEDNEINRSVLSAFLSRLPVNLTMVENGAKAVEMADAQPFDIILMDVQMPILDGVNATKQIRAGQGPCRHTPIIALTANAMPGDQKLYLDAGMTGYVSKPIDPEALFTALKTAKPLPGYDADQHEARTA